VDPFDPVTNNPCECAEPSLLIAGVKNMLRTVSATAKAGRKLSFKSKLENWADGMDYCAIPVPANITEELGTKSAVLVLARVNGCAPFKVSLFPVGGGRHFIRLRKRIRKEANVNQGDPVLVHITVLDRADIEIPRDLSAALRGKNALARFNALTPGKKNYMVRRIDDAAKPETRAKRVLEAVEETCRAKETRAV
jgi:uncharacterized protein DUF1905/bacteriocin resistance YdeI/OmpD-like protein